jgi:hypothetical protein
VKNQLIILLRTAVYRQRLRLTQCHLAAAPLSKSISEEENCRRDERRPVEESWLSVKAMAKKSAVMTADGIQLGEAGISSIEQSASENDIWRQREENMAAKRREGGGNSGRRQTAAQ